MKQKASAQTPPPREIRIRKSGFVCVRTSGLFDSARGTEDTIPPRNATTKRPTEAK